MLKLIGYLKPYLGIVILSLALLFTQAMCDLNLPNYMANIVNTGIQRAGVETLAPKRIDAESLSLLLSVSGTEDADAIASSYSESETDAGIYVLNGDADTASLEGAVTNAAQTLFILAGAPEGFDADAALSLDVSDGARVESARGEAMLSAESVREQNAVYLVRSLYARAGGDPDRAQMDFIYRSGALMLLISLIGVAAAIGVGFLSSRVSAGVARDLRSDLFKKVESFSNSEFDKFSTASLITRTTNDITQIQLVTTLAMRIMIYAPIMGVGGVVMVISRSLSMTWTIVLSVGILIAMIIVVFLVAMPKFKIIQSLIDKLNLVARENLTGVTVTRAFGAEDFEHERFDDANTALMKTNLFVNRVIVVMMPSMMLIMNLTMLLVLWTGAGRINAGELMVGDVMAFLQYAMHIIMSFFIISVMFIMVPRASVAGDRVYEVLSCAPSIVDREDALSMRGDERGTVEFEHVSFRYGEAENDVLHDISFSARPGRTTAIIGATGSGKTTLLNLILRFYDVTGGSVRVGGVDVRNLKQSELRREIGYVPQKGTLFSGTIESNLRYADENATEDDMARAIEVSQSAEFVAKKEEGIRSPVAQGGSNVSGGQRQRLGIARAILRKAPIYIFDDSFSALDFKTDARLRRELRRYVKNATVIIVAQRVSTIMNADEILVLDEGRIVGRGRHDELLSSCSVYREIAASQLGLEAV
ncbi:MAG: ABC transporter ATP-binding protein [Clostridia bacterium]|nr:ABC transporter ATP-binding protein [Clostridia bacterium]